MILYLSCFIILLETYLDKHSPEYYERTYVLLIKISNILFFLIFSIEVTIKSIVYGFCLNKHSFLRSFFNILDIFIILGYATDLTFYEEEFAFNISTVI